jgi:BON domain-containing protein
MFSLTFVVGALLRHRLLTGMLLATVSLIYGPAAAWAIDEQEFSRDLLQTVEARRALLQDRELAPLNLGVKVHNRVAVLWGPVPSAELAKKAVRLLSMMPELSEIVNELKVCPEFDKPARPPAAPELITKTIHFPSGSPAMLTNLSQDRNDGRNTAPAVQAPPKERTGWQPLARLARDPRIPDQTEIEAVLPVMRLPTPSLAEVAGGPGKTLDESLRELRQNPRYRNIGIDTYDGVVTLRGDPTEAIYDLAHAISRLHGVRRILIRGR